MSQEPFSFLAKVSNPVRQIVYNTILSDLPPVNKCNILWYALEHDEPRHIFEKELVSREQKVWQTFPEEAFSGLNERTKSILLQAIHKQEASECKQLLLQYPQDHSRNLLESWYNNVKDDDAVYHRIFEGMKQQLCQLPEQGQEAIVVLNSQTPEAGWDSHCGSRDKEVEPNSAQVEKMYWEKSGAVETISATNSNHNRFKTYVARGNKIDFDRSSIQGQGFRNIVERQTAKRTTNSFDYEVSNLSFCERLAAASAHFDRNHPSISPSPSSKAQVQYYRPSEVPFLADQCPGIGYQPSQQHVGQNSSGIDHGVSHTMNAVRASVDLGNVPLSEEHSKAGYEKNYGKEILNETGDNIGYPNVVQTIDPDLKSPALSEPSTSFHSLNSQPDQSSLQHERDTGQETRIKQDFGTDEVPQEDIYNVLLLGETGVGKTTFINSCANYIKFNTMEEALAEGPEILMNSTFTASEAVGTVKITVLATTGETGAKNSTNEHSEQAGESRTQEPLIHKMTWFAENERRKLLRIIDTPGVNDTRGQDRDAVNFKKVLHLIQRIGKLHAICLLLKPNESVMSVGFRRSLDYFLTKLHSSALENILFCFTNTRSTFYLPGETYTLLETYFKDLKAANGIEITLNLSNVFCFENDCFRYMCLLMNDRNRLTQHHKQVAKSWEHNIPEIRKFLDRIQLLNPHLTEDTTNMDTVSELLSELVRPLMETMQSLVNNQDQVVRLKEKINKSTHSEAELRNLMHTKMVVLRKQFLPQPRLICTAIKCSQKLYLNDGTIVYEPGKACHDPCHFPQLIRDRQNQQMASCPIFSRKGVCTKCHCPKAYHQHIGYKLYKDTEDIIREDVRQRLEECTSETERQKLMLDNLNNTLDQLNSEINAIKSACTEFSTFLLYSSLKAGADPYSIYLDILIRNEKDKQTGNELRYKLEDILKRHNLDVQRIVQNVRTGQQLKLTYDQINTKIAFLCSLQSSGRLISEIVEGVAKSGGSNGNQ